MSKRDMLALTLRSENSDNGTECRFLGLFDANIDGVKRILHLIKVFKEEMIEEYRRDDEDPEDVVYTGFYFPRGREARPNFKDLLNWLNSDTDICYININVEDYEWNTIYVSKCHKGEFQNQYTERQYQERGKNIRWDTV